MESKRSIILNHGMKIDTEREELLSLRPTRKALVGLESDDKARRMVESWQRKR